MNKQEFLAISYTSGLICKTTLGDVESKNLILPLGGIIKDYYRFYHKGDYANITIDEITPILRHLSDLTKEIEHKGEKFVPIEKLREIIGGSWCSVYERAVELMQEWYIDTLKDKIKYLPFEFIQLFISWHFDIADLITKGEAINVNTLEENPYK